MTVEIVGINLSSTSLTTPGLHNAGVKVGDIGITTSPPGQDTGIIIRLSLSAGDSNKFVLSSGVAPSSLLIGRADIPAGSYYIAITAAALPFQFITMVFNIIVSVRPSSSLTSTMALPLEFRVSPSHPSTPIGSTMAMPFEFRTKSTSLPPGPISSAPITSTPNN